MEIYSAQCTWLCLGCRSWIQTYFTPDQEWTQTIHVLYNYLPNNKKNDDAWQKVADAAEIVYPFIIKQFGDYPYKQYSFLWGGTAVWNILWLHCWMGRALVRFSWWMHTWYQMMLGTNESFICLDGWRLHWVCDRPGWEFYNSEIAKHQWYGYLLTMNCRSTMLPITVVILHWWKAASKEPMTTHADHFNTNYAYSIASYSKDVYFFHSWAISQVKQPETKFCWSIIVCGASNIPM